jgi:hypothetical protein
VAQVVPIPARWFLEQTCTHPLTVRVRRYKTNLTTIAVPTQIAEKPSATMLGQR